VGRGSGLLLTGEDSTSIFARLNFIKLIITDLFCLVDNLLGFIIGNSLIHVKCKSRKKILPSALPTSSALAT
jgi:hypothetical protein